MTTHKSSGTVHVYSTLAAPQHYQNYGSSPNDLRPLEGEGVRIEGGHGLAHQDRANGLFTPMGIRTEVSADQLAYLKQNPSFLEHEKRGYIKVMDSKVDPEKAAGDMQTRNGSSPLVPQDFKEEEEPIVGKGHKK